MTPGIRPADVASELVWDAGKHGTAIYPDGPPIGVSGPSGWPPELLLATGAAVSIMTRFLELAAEAHIDVLGYLSRQEVTSATVLEEPLIEMSVCIVVSTPDMGEMARTMLETSRTSAALTRLLRRPPMIDVHIKVVREPGRRPGPQLWPDAS
jgi:Zn-dependent M28 family amino/carboxypeptidase